VRSCASDPQEFLETLEEWQGALGSPATDDATSREHINHWYQDQGRGCNAGESQSEEGHMLAG